MQKFAICMTVTALVAERCASPTPTPTPEPTICNRIVALAADVENNDALVEQAEAFLESLSDDQLAELPNAVADAVKKAREAFAVPVVGARAGAEALQLIAVLCK